MLGGMRVQVNERRWSLWYVERVVGETSPMNRPQLAKRKESPFRGSFFGDLTPGGTSVIIRGTGTPWSLGVWRKLEQ